jgi:hypothetical protein
VHVGISLGHTEHNLCAVLLRWNLRRNLPNIFEGPIYLIELKAACVSLFVY